MTIEAQVQQILANQATIISNQATILTAVQAIPGVDTAAVTAALTQIEGQVTDIQSQLETPAVPAAGAAPAAGATGGTAA